MSQIVYLLRPREEVSQFTREVAQKFKLTHGIELNVRDGKNINEVAGLIEDEAIAIIFTEATIPPSDLNTLAGVCEKPKKKPFVIVKGEVHQQLTDAEVLKGVLPKNKIGKSTADFNPAFIYNCLRNLLTPPGLKLDIRYIKSIVISVGEVIASNTQCQMTPEAIQEVKAKEVPTEVTSIAAFFGDGFLGSLTISTSRSLMEDFAAKMLQCEKEDISASVLVDLVSEVANQILGVVRKSLAEFGWSLNMSLQAVTVGEEILHASSSNGRYYYLPFVYEGVQFDVNLCYNTYQTSIFEIEEESEMVGRSCLDVRLVDIMSDSILKILPQSVQTSVRLGKVTKHKPSLYECESIHIFHAGSWQAGIMIGLLPPSDLTAHIMKITMGMEADDIEDSMVNDFWGEVVNQVAGDFLKVIKSKENYSLQRIFQGSFSSKKIDYLLRNPGFYYRQMIHMENFEMELVFGVNSTFASEYFNIWPYFNGQEEFIS